MSSAILLASMEAPNNPRLDWGLAGEVLELQRPHLGAAEAKLRRVAEDEAGDGQQKAVDQAHWEPLEQKHGQSKNIKTNLHPRIPTSYHQHLLPGEPLAALIRAGVDNLAEELLGALDPGRHRLRILPGAARVMLWMPRLLSLGVFFVSLLRAKSMPGTSVQSTTSDASDGSDCILPTVYSSSLGRYWDRQKSCDIRVGLHFGGTYDMEKFVAPIQLKVSSISSMHNDSNMLNARQTTYSQFRLIYLQLYV
nr:hypothetical protein Iba_chr10eCG15000 [Ipomoea batatas]